MNPKDKALDLCGDFYAIKSNEPEDKKLRI